MRRLFSFWFLVLLCASLSGLAQRKPVNHSKLTPEIKNLIEQGNAAIDRAEWQPALQLFEQVRVLSQQQKSVTGEVFALSGRGIVYSNTAQAQKALQALQQALALARQLEDLHLQAIQLNTIGIVYQRMNQLEQAAEHFQQALTLFRRLGDGEYEGGILVNLGNIAALQGEYPSALKLFQQGLPLIRQTGSKAREANLLSGIGSAYASMGQPDKGITFFLQSLALRRDLQDSFGEATTLSNLGLAYRDLGDYAKALEFYEQALAMARKLQVPNNEANVLYNMGSVHALLSNLNQAEIFFERSLAIREKIRAAIGGSAGNRQAYLASVLPTYTRLADAQINMGQAERAFATVNKMKARTLLEQGAEKTTLVGIPLDAQKRLMELRQQNDRSSVRLAATRGKNAVEERQLREQISQTERDISTEQDRLFSLYAGAAQRNITRTLTAADVASFLPADTALLEYAALVVKVGKQKLNRLAVFVVTMDNGKPQVTAHAIAANNNDVAALAEAFRVACANPKRNEKTLARELQSLLMPSDVLARLGSKTRLILCPDDEVWNVPFAALILPDGKRVIEQFEIDYAYSATGVQAALMAARRSPAQTVMVLANPDFGDTSRFGENLPDQIAKGTERPLSEPTRPRTDDKRPLADPARPLFDPARMGSMVERGKIKPLPGTQVEANAIRALYPEATLLTGASAQEAELVKQLPNFRYLHFATHGLFSDAAPLQSAIVLAQPPPDSPDDGFLTAREIYDLNLNADMAVLSACETARGEVKVGEGVVGLTWALFAAGVPTQVVSQWKVSDASTPELMAAFYSNLKAGQSKGSALRNAALKMMRDGKHAHPYHWAAFVCFGDWR